MGDFDYIYIQEICYSYIQQELWLHIKKFKSDQNGTHEDENNPVLVIIASADGIAFEWALLCSKSPHRLIIMLDVSNNICKLKQNDSVVVKRITFQVVS